MIGSTAIHERPKIENRPWRNASNNDHRMTVDPQDLGIIPWGWEASKMYLDVTARSILDGYFNPNKSFGLNGNIYVHQQRICHFLQGI